jgi:hypothetical protein
MRFLGKHDYFFIDNQILISLFYWFFVGKLGILLEQMLGSFGGRRALNL